MGLGGDMSTWRTMAIRTTDSLHRVQNYMYKECWKGEAQGAGRSCPGLLADAVDGITGSVNTIYSHYIQQKKDFGAGSLRE